MLLGYHKKQIWGSLTTYAITFAAYYFHCTDLPYNNVQFMELFIKY